MTIFDWLHGELCIATSGSCFRVREYILDFNWRDGTDLLKCPLAISISVAVGRFTAIIIAKLLHSRKL